VFLFLYITIINLL